MMRARNRQRGAALVELAVILPLLLLVLIGATDFGRMTYLSVLVSNAAAAGARYASQSIDNAGDITAVRNAALADIGTRGIGRDLTVDAERFCTCAPSDTATSCDSLCPLVAGYPSQPRMFVEVSVATTFDTVFEYPGLPRSVTIARQLRTRAQ